MPVLERLAEAQELELMPATAPGTAASLGRECAAGGPVTELEQAASAPLKAPEKSSVSPCTHSERAQWSAGAQARASEGQHHAASPAGVAEAAGGGAGAGADATGRKPTVQALSEGVGAVAGIHERPRSTDNDQRVGAGLRMSAVFRKVTNGFRVEWGVELYGGARTAVATGRQQGFTALTALRTTLEDGSILPPPLAPCAE